MKHKIISLLSYSTLTISSFMAPFMALVDLRFLPTCIWVLAVWLAMLGSLSTYPEMENAPDERQLNRGHRKIYNISLTDGRMMVNGIEYGNPYR